MKQSVLEQIFFARGEGGNRPLDSDRYWELTNELADILKCLGTDGSCNYKEQIEQLDRLIAEKESETAKQNFTSGFKTAIRTMVECIKDE